jgi:ABC-type sugar transport system ATPase subunit
MALSNRVTVLRDGEKIFTKYATEFDKDMLVQGIIGTHTDGDSKIKAIKKRDYQVLDPVLEVKGLNKERQLDDVSFILHKGEVLGITGVSGSGISEIGKVLFGIDDEFSGEVLLDGERVVSHSPHEAVLNGFGYVPKNRKEEGIIPGLSVGYNIILSALKDVFVHGFEYKKRMNEIVNNILEVIDLRPRDPENLISILSGGNQQKAVIARWITKSAHVLILDEPTRGVDVGAIEKIYAIIHDMTLDGTSVIIISSEFEEVHAASDRMIVLKKGKIVGEIDPKNRSWKEAFSLAIK